MFEALAERSPQSMALIDSSIIRAHQHAAGGKKGLGALHRPFSWRTNAVVDGDGLPIRLALTPGQASDKEAAVGLIASLTKTSDLVADRGYDARALVDLAQIHGVRAHNPTQRDRRVQRAVDPEEVYRQRNLVEHFFNKLKHSDALRPASTSSPGTSSLPSPLASVRLWTRAYESTT